MENPDVENAPKTTSSILTSKLSNGSQSTSGEGLDRRLEKKMWTKQRIVMAAEDRRWKIGIRKLEIENRSVDARHDAVSLFPHFPFSIF